MQFFVNVWAFAARDTWNQYKNGAISLVYVFSIPALIIALLAANAIWLVRLNDENFEIPMWMNVVQAGASLSGIVLLYFYFLVFAVKYFATLPAAEQAAYK